MNKAIKIGLIALAAMVTSSAMAQSNADKQYVQDLKSKLDVLMQEADGYYKSTVKPLEKKQIMEIDREDHSAKQKQLQALYDNEANYNTIIDKCNKDLSIKNGQLDQKTSASLKKDIKVLEQQRGAAQRELDAIKPEIKRLEDILSNNLKINNENKSIINDRKQVNETWSSKKDAIDKTLYDACLYCVDRNHPCDTIGNNEWLRKEVEKLTDTKSKYPQSEDYKKLFSQFHELFNNYKAYTLEIGEFLQNCYKYNKGNGELTNAMRNEINAELKNLKYWKYYSNRNGKNAVHSRNLDYILGEFEAMFNTNFKNCKARYRKLGPMLRGVGQQY